MSLRSLRNLRTALAALLLIALLGTVASCGLVVSFGSYDTSAPALPTHAMGGTAVGLGGETVKVILNGDSTTDGGDRGGDDVGDGPFVLSARLASRASYVVTLGADPPGHVCSVVAGNSGIVGDGDVTDIRILCKPSSDANLTSLVLSAGPIHPAFEPQQLMYDGISASTFLAATTTVRATPADPKATVIIAGVAAVSEVAMVPLIPNSSIDVVVTAADGTTKRTYRVAVGGRPIEYLTPATASVGANFGASIALSGDTLAVGVPMNQATQPNPGAVYIFTRTMTAKGMAWSQQAYLTASNSRDGAKFGGAVALSGDTLAVGSTYESSKATGVNGDQTDTSSFQAGAVYIFVRTGTGAGAAWSQEAYVKASNTKPKEQLQGAQFGFSVALSEDTLAVAAQFESSAAKGVNGDQTDTSADFAGAAYVFTRTMGVWSQQAYLKASNTRRLNYFGSALALSGDTLAVGSVGEKSGVAGVNSIGAEMDTSTLRAGAVYVFTRTEAIWSQQAYVKASNPGAGSLPEFGAAVALTGNTLAVGAPGESSSATGVDGNQEAAGCCGISGAAYVFTRAGVGDAQVWSQQAYVKASYTRSDAAFGTSVALWGDTLAVGAAGEAGSARGVNGSQDDTSVPKAGAAYVFTRKGAAWSQHAYVKASDTHEGASFGCSLALSDSALAVGSSDESKAGAAYVFQ